MVHLQEVARLIYLPVSLRQDIHPVVTLLGASKMSGITKEFLKAAILGMEI